MQMVRYWRMQATRYRLSDLRPPISTPKKDATKTAPVGNQTNSEQQFRKGVAQPIPITN